MDTNHLLDTIEAELTQHRAFGDSEYIRGQVVRCLERRLNQISPRIPVAGHLLDVLSQAETYARYRVLGDSVVRCVIEQALVQLETGSTYGLPLNECAEVLQETVRLVKDDKLSGPMESRVEAVDRLGTESYHGWVWSEEQPDDIFGRSFRNIVKSYYGESLYTPNAEEIAMLRRATCLLEELLPSVSQSALSHAQIVAVFPAIGKWKGRSSASQIRITGTFFLSRAGLDEPWYLAEHIFHEALHQKLYDFRLGHSLLEPSYLREDAPKICSLWNEPSKLHNWDTHRAVAAFHVYVHLGLLCTIAERRAPELEAVYGRPQAMTGSRKSLERARYLGEQIKESCWEELGPAGKCLIDWLMSVLDVLDASPPPERSFIHLLLDRYEREASRATAVLSRIGPQGFDGKAKADIPRQLTDLVREEANNVCSALSAVHAGENLNRFNNAIAQFSDAELGVRFGEVRKIISRTLLDLSPDGRGYRLDGSSLESKRAEEIVKQMVESSSPRLENILAQ